jgi:CheY-like chemotaxis protein
MSHVLLVEPDDDFCLSLRHAVCDAHHHATITGSLAEAREALRCGTHDVDLVITNTVLPDGSGLALVREAMGRGKAIFLLRANRGRIEVSDHRGVVFRGERLAAGEFLRKAMLDGPPGKSAETEFASGTDDPGSFERGEPV